MLNVFSDGGSRGNPGPGAIGVVIFDENNKYPISKYINICTNNEAEYTAVIEGLEKIIELNLKNKKILWKLDSELVVNQLNGVYKIKKQELLILNKKIKDLIRKNKIDIDFMHISRSENKIADNLVNQALDEVLKGVKLNSLNNQSGYTFVEILIASIIFISVISIASVGFAQVLKYRSLINAQIAVNQVARTLTETINREVRQSVNKEIRVSDNDPTTPDISQKNLLLIAKVDNRWVNFKCNDDLVSCNQIVATRQDSGLFLLIHTIDKIKVYEFKPISPGDPSQMLYQEFGLEGVITMNDLYDSARGIQKGVLAISGIDAETGFKGMVYMDTDIPPRLEYNIGFGTSNFSDTGVRAYEKSFLNIQGAVTARNY